LLNINIIKNDKNISATYVTGGKVSIASIDNLMDGRWWISRVNIQGAKKGKGLGSKLLQTAIKEVLSFGETEIIVAPGGYTNNIEKQINFYKKNGFSVINEEGLMAFKAKKKDEILITDHAYLRAKERLSLNKKSIDRLAKVAYVKGIKQSDTKGQLKKYVDKLYFEYKTANNIRIYGEVIFLFSKNTLVTLYQVPNEFRRLLKHFR
jgi:hypothetical protein